MNFLFPAVFWLAAAAPVIVLLYLRRSRRRTETVSTLMFWQRVMAASPQKRFLGALRSPLSLLLQLLIFLMILMAALHPRFGLGREPRSTVVVIDSRARMQAGDTFRKAIAAAGSVANQAGPDDEVAILSAESSPHLVSGFSRDAKTLRSRLSQLSASDGGGNIGESIELARRLLAARSGVKRLMVISDRALPKLSEAEQVPVGSSADNVGIVACSARPLPASPQTFEVLARVANFSAAPRDAGVSFSLDNRIVEMKRLRIDPGAEANAIATIPSEVLKNSKGLVEVRLDQPDSLAIDNVAYAALPVNESRRVLLISKRNPFLDQALQANPDIRLEVLDPEVWKPGMASSFDVVVLEGAAARNFKPEPASQFGVLFFGDSPFDNGDPVKPDPVQVADSRNPLLWNVNLRDVRFARVQPTVIPENSPWRTAAPVTSPQGPLILTMESIGGPARAAIFAFGVEDSNLPLRAAFPLLLANTIQWLSGSEKSPVRTFAAGDVFQAAEGESILSPEPSNVATLRKAGFYEIRGKDTSHWIAANTSATAESDLRKAESRPFSALSAAAVILPPWQWFALCALVLLLIEWRLHHRRVTE